MAATATKAKDILTLSPIALIVSLSAYVRLVWKGYPPELPSDMTDSEGVLWTATPDFKTREVKLYARYHHFNADKETRVEHWFIPISRFEEIKL